MDTWKHGTDFTFYPSRQIQGKDIWSIKRELLKRTAYISQILSFFGCRSFVLKQQQQINE